MHLLKNKIVWLVFIALLVRVTFGLIYPVKSFPDSREYIRTGRQLVTGDFSDYTGRRTPVYPLILAALNYNQKATVAVQAAMGISLSLLLYLIFTALTKNETIGFVVSLTYVLNPSQLLFEFSLLSETSCTFLLILTIYLFFRMIQKDRSPGRIELFALGVISSLCLLNRPQYLILPLLLAIFLLYQLKYRVKANTWPVALYIAPVILIVLAWSSFQYAKLGKFAITPNLGYNLMNHTLRYIEHTPDRYDKIKQVLIRHRDLKVQRTGEPYAAQADARPELFKLTGLSYAGLSDKLAEITIATIKEKPLLYLESVIIAFVRFFKPTWYARLFGIRAAISKGGWPLKIVAAVYAVCHLACMSIFLLFPILAIFFSSFRNLMKWDLRITFIYTLVLFTGVTQALIEFGENARYKISVEPLMIGLAVWVVMLTANHLLAHKRRLKNQL